MKRIMMLAAVFALTLGAPVAEAQRVTDQERRELEARLAQLRAELAELEAKLGRRGMVYRFDPRDFSGTAVWSTARQRPRLGVVIATGRQPETDSIGAVLQAVTPDGPAHDAGLRASDIVTRFHGEALANARPYPGDRLIELAREMEEGDSVAVSYRRNRETRTATIVPEVLDDFTYATVMPRISGNLFVDSLHGVLDSSHVALRSLNREGDILRLMPSAYGFSVGFGTRWADMELVELNSELGDYFGATGGLLVIKPPRDSLLQLRSGDVILRIGGRVPNSPSHAVRIFRSYEPGDEIRLEVMRQKRRQELRAVVPEAGRRSAR